MSISKFFKHLMTVEHHRHLVFKHCCKAGIGFQGLFHDLSKFSLVEFAPSVKYFQGNASPNELERKEKGYSTAWLHHKGRNKHHHEYWNDFNETTHQYEPVKMPLKYVKEMFCDRIAASKTYKKKEYNDSCGLNYYLYKNTRALLHPQTADLLESWLRMLAEKGEKETFKQIRKTKKY